MQAERLAMRQSILVSVSFTIAPADIVGLTVVLADTVPIRHVMVASGPTL